MTAARPVATRIDERLGISETAGFFGPGPPRLMGVVHAPRAPAPSAAGAVICPSICNDFLRNYSREVALARELARRGIAAHRFHYRGTGNSDGDESGVTFGAMVDDVHAAVDRLRDATGVDRVALVGTRFSGPLVTAAAAAWPEAPLVLVDPVAEGSAFFREAWRAALIGQLGKGATTTSLVIELRERGAVDVLGHEVHLPLFESSIDQRLAGSLAGTARDILVFHFGATLPAALAAFVSSVGADVELAGRPYVWWAVDEEEGVKPDDSFVPTVSRWLAARLGAEP